MKNLKSILILLFIICPFYILSQENFTKKVIEPFQRIINIGEKYLYI